MNQTLDLQLRVTLTALKDSIVESQAKLEKLSCDCLTARMLRANIKRHLGVVNAIQLALEP
jgi:hypothetical protein